MVQRALGGLPEILQEDPGGHNLGGVLIEAIPLQVCHPELPLQALPACPCVEAPVREAIDQEAFLFPQEVAEECVLHEKRFLGDHFPWLEAMELPFQDLLSNRHGKRGGRELSR